MLDFVEGQFFKDATLSSITSPETRKEMYFHLLDSLAKIHAVDVDGERLLTYSFFLSSWLFYL
jgi:aminoglycoside phosphotransferase (APT) family kinase protein